MVKITEIEIRHSDVATLRKWVEDNEPYEACALLLGRFKNSTAQVDEIILTPNSSKSRVHFEIEPELLLKILLKAEEKQKDLVSIFHSHPTTPYPSGIDIPYMQNYPDTVWLILGLPRTEPMHGYQWIDGKIVEVKVKISA
ncbi:MAG: Mov34/MPN/PAD-1 family protein [Candidatus Helarchaeota archaeon]